jgi:hypothetical protein
MQAADLDRLVGGLFVVVGAVAMIVNVRRPRDWVSPTYSWATRDRQVILDAILIVVGIVIFLVAAAL